MSIAGRLDRRRFTALPNQTENFTWDGRDGYGRQVVGAQNLRVRVGYAYELEYVRTTRFGYNGNGAISAIPSRQEFILWQVWDIPLFIAKDASGQLGGWTLDVHHAYDPYARNLYLGNGTRRSADSLNYPILDTAVGRTGLQSVAAGPDGSLYLGAGSRVYRMDAQGTVTPFAGNGTGCFGGPGSCGDGGLATQAQLYTSSGLALGSDGSFYIAEGQANRIRRIDSDGIITTVAGNGQNCPFPYNSCFAGDGGPSTQARLGFPHDVAIGPDGSLYIADTMNARIRRVDASGIIHTVAGGGGTQPWVDGIPATSAVIGRPDGIEVARDGSLYILSRARISRVRPDGTIWSVAGNGGLGHATDGTLATQGPIDAFGNALVMPDGGVLFLERHFSCKLRRVSPQGVLTTLAGNDTCSYGGDGGPARQAAMNLGGAGFGNPLALGPDGSIYIADYFNGRARRLRSALPGAATGQYVIASEDGGQVFIFDGDGRHLRTLHALTGALLYRFDYDGRGRLVSITDGDGNVTTIQRDADRDTDGNPTAITGPYGQTTRLSLDPNGYLALVTNPAGEQTRMSYTRDGLLTGMTTPLGHASTFTYTAEGRLTRDQDAAGGVLVLRPSQARPGYSVSVTTALSRTTIYQVTTDHLGNQTRIITQPSGLRTEQISRADGTRRWQAADGTTVNVTLGPDPRWNMLAPVQRTASIATPAGLTATVTTQRAATLAQATNPLSLIALHQTVDINGRIYSGSYTSATRTFTHTTPTGRQRTIVIDHQGRPVRSQTAGQEPLTYTYDSRGRIVAAAQGSGPGARTAALTYDSAGYLTGITDPLGRAVQFGYDLAGRVTTQTLPDGRVVAYVYDVSGNLTSLTPPGRPAHTFTYTPVDRAATYTPPDVGIGQTQTAYVYDADRQLTRLQRPDGKAIDLGYDVAGRITAVTVTRGVINVTYHPTTGNPMSILAPGGTQLGLSYDGGLLTRQDWSGPITGSVSYGYDNHFRRTSIRVNGADAIGLGYDADGLLTTTGAMTLTRSRENGLPVGSVLGRVTDSVGYNGFGEPVSYTAELNGAVILGFEYGYDKLGRIVTRTETVRGVKDVYAYGYDLAGRLEMVRKNGATVSTYGYDANGNRVSYTGPGGAMTGTYDAQDRLLRYGNTAYTYSANGELQSKTAGGQTTIDHYDELGNLVRVVLPGGTQIDYLIDGLNRRIGKRVNGALVQGFLYDGQLRIVAELDGAGHVVSRFVYATRINVPDYMIRGGVTYRLLTDHLGSPRLVVDTITGQVVQRMDYDEFGGVLMDTNLGFQPFGFAGGLYDRDTGLVRFGARDYAAEVGRWTAKDMIGFAGADSNLYGYAGADPINVGDPTGLMNPSGGINGAATCPRTEPNSCESSGPQWKRDKWLGEVLFHGGATCYREVRLASGTTTAQCCYRKGLLLPEGRSDSGSADEYDPDLEPWNHTMNDRGGIVRWFMEFVVPSLPYPGPLSGKL